MSLREKIYGKLKNIHLGRPPLISKKKFWFINTTRLHSFTLVLTLICLGP